MRCLVAGTGSIGRRHIQNLVELLDDCEIVLLRKGGNSDDYSRAIKATIISDIGNSLAAGFDLAIIATPTVEHAGVLDILLQARVPVYVEKPVVATTEQLRRIQERIAISPVMPVTMAGCNLRYLPSLRMLKESLKAGLIGTLVRANLQAGQWLPDWRPQQDYRESYSADPDKGGGVILDLVHEIDIARWLLGEFDQVKAFAGKQSSLQIDSEDTACILLANSSSGMMACVSLDYVSRQPVRRYEFVGDKGTIIWDLHDKALRLIDPSGVNSLDCGTSGYDVAGTYKVAMTEFIACVREGRESSQGIIEGLRSAELAIRIRQVAGL